MGATENKPNEQTEGTGPTEGAATEAEGTEPTEGQGGDGTEGVKDTHGQPGIKFDYQSERHCSKTTSGDGWPL